MPTDFVVMYFTVSTKTLPIKRSKSTKLVAQPAMHVIIMRRGHAILDILVQTITTCLDHTQVNIVQILVMQTNMM